MRFIDWFAGIGGFRHGMELAGHECVGFCEWDKYAAASYTSMHLITEDQREYLAALSLKQRQKEILKEEYRNGEWYADDIRTVDAGSIPEADCWCFGAPCQDFSIAGKRAGLDGDRSSLVREVFRLLGEIREENRPEWLLYENVKGMLSSNKGFDFFTILLAMDELGYDIEWQLFNSKNWEVPQNRERIYTIGHLRTRGPAKILPLAGADGENCIRQLRIPTRERELSMAIPCFVDMNHGAGIKQTENARNLQARYYKGVCNRSGETSGVAIPVLTQDQGNKQQNGRHWGALNPLGGIYTNVSPEYQRGILDNYSRSLKANKSDSGVVLKVRDNTTESYAIAREGDAIDLKSYCSSTRRGTVKGEIAGALDHDCSQGIFVRVSDELTVYAIWYEQYQCYIAIRRLTPKECFRLQGWEDIYFERAAFVNSDSQLYRQAGNGVTVNVVYAIGSAIRKLEIRP